MKVPITKPYLTKESEEVVASVIQIGWVSQGPKVAEFEEKVATYVGAQFAVAVSSGTAALHLALLLSGAGTGCEVICPSYTFVATANSIIHTGAKPVLVDIDPRTYNIDPSKIEAAITERTRAIVPVHQVGLPACMDEILNIAQSRGLKVIEDAACALGAEYKGRKVGSIGPVSCFSFHPRKVITTGEGGMITTDNEELANRARALRAHGACSFVPNPQEPAARRILAGYNYKMTDMQAALGVQQMEQLEFVLEKRSELAAAYDDMLEGVEEIQTPYVPDYAKHNYQSYVVRLTHRSRMSQDEVLKRMSERSISCKRGIPPIHQETYYRLSFGNISLPVTEELSRSTFMLPLYPEMTREVQEHIVAALRDVL